jgi:hypothetical protein
LSSEADDSGISGETRRETPEIVEQNPSFDCEEMVCIATDGLPGYCSKRCREDAGCPDGFGCREVQQIGPFAGEKFCAWKECSRRADCGKKEDFCCVTVQSSDPIIAELAIRICAFSKDGKCK